MSTFNRNAPTAVYRCDSYDSENIELIISEMAEKISAVLPEENFKDKKIVIKPNLVMKKDPSSGAITHPAVIEGVVLWLTKSLGVAPSNITIAESPGGPYIESSLRAFYAACGVEAAARRFGINLNYDTSYITASNPGGKISKLFDVITPVAAADIVINICKLKSHALTGMTAAVKNFFGIIPGTRKFEMHARYPDLGDFAQMMNDICLWVHQNKKVISVCDGIVGMEGNGPTSGTPRKIGVLIMSENSFALDMAAAHITNLSGSVKMLDLAKERNLIPEDISSLNLCGEDIGSLVIKDFKKSDADRRDIFKSLPNIMGGRVVKFIEPKPAINEQKCLGCSECVRSCPVEAVTIKTKNKRRIAEIHREKCIKCFCCQELCPHAAVKIKKNPIFKIMR